MNFKRIITAIVFLIAIFMVTGAYSQINYNNVKVDELSDAQIRQMMTQAESVGYSDLQMEQMAAARGMAPDEVQKLHLRVTKIREQGAAISTEVKAQNSGREFTETTDGGAIDNEKKEDDKEIGAKIFGTELFKNGSITFEPNLRIATPKGYIIGPDDRLLIDITGDNEASYNLPVSTEGYINLQYVGRIAVGGLTIDQAISKIRSLMASTYPSLRTGRTSLAINLGNIRSIKVTITGQAVKTGTYTLSSLSTVYNALYASGGPSANGSFRNIQVIRNNKVISTIDVYNFLLNGIQGQNIRLQDQDVINIPVYNKRVEITGEVKQAAIYEIVDGESIQDIINFAGGFTTQAYMAKIKSFQNTDRERKILDISASQYNTYVPKNGDKYIVEAILDRFENRVEIMGAVFRPGLYELNNGMSLRQLILKADGLTEDAFLNRGYINRLNLDNTLSLISFDLRKVMAESANDIILQREDKVTVSSIFDLRDEYKVSIQGEVRAPGTFDYSQNLNLESLIQMAGGFKEGATPDRIEISRRVKDSDVGSKSAVTAELFTVNIDRDLKFQSDNFILSPFDIVTVRSSTGYEVQKQVKIEGEVLYPGIYTVIRKDDRISDLIKRAGGLTPSAYQEGASLKRPGPNAKISENKNEINNQKEDELTLINLKRAQQEGATESEGAYLTEKMIASDLVGINLVKIINTPGSRFDLFLEEGDIIRIPRQLQTVKVAGEVLSPNSIVYSPGKSFRQYINNAGGFTFDAYKKGLHIKYANGSVEAAKKFLFFNNYPKVKPGSEILVPRRAQREKMNVQSWIGLGTAVASMAAIVVSLLR